MAREADLVRKIVQAVKKEYPSAYVRKISDRYNRGLPDLLILFRARRTIFGQVISGFAGMLWVECKTERGRLSKVQKVEIEAIVAVDAVGLDVIVSRDVAKVLDTLEEMGAVP